MTQAAPRPQGFDIWHVRAVFHFLTGAAGRAAYVAQVRAALRPGGQAIVAAFVADGPTQCSGLPVVRDPPHELHEQFGVAFELVAHVREVHHTLAGVAPPFVYCRCIVH